MRAKRWRAEARFGHFGTVHTYLIERHFGTVSYPLDLFHVVGEPFLHVSQSSMIDGAARVGLILCLEVAQVVVGGQETFDDGSEVPTLEKKTFIVSWLVDK